MELGAPSAVPIASGGVVRTYDEEMSFIEQVTPTCFKIKPGFVPNMTVPGYFYVNSSLSELMFGELQQYGESAGVGGFMPAVKQIANVAALPGIVGVCLPPPKKKKNLFFSQRSVALPDCHSGYGFAIGNVAAMDMEDPNAVVSPGKQKCLFLKNVKIVIGCSSST